MKPFMSGDLSSESETWRANTPAWHAVSTGFTVTFSEKPCQEDFGGRGNGGRQWNHLLLDLLVLLVTWKLLLGVN